MRLIGVSLLLLRGLHSNSLHVTWGRQCFPKMAATIFSFPMCSFRILPHLISPWTILDLRVQQKRLLSLGPWSQCNLALSLEVSPMEPRYHTVEIQATWRWTNFPAKRGSHFGNGASGLQLATLHNTALSRRQPSLLPKCRLMNKISDWCCLKRLSLGVVGYLASITVRS